MMNNYSGKEEKIQLFRSLFRGRTDVFAQRWEKADGSASGYFPVPVPKKYNDVCFCERKRKVRCKYCEERGYLPLSDSVIEDHLIGRRVIGVYPLLPDNSSYFLAADFDGENWIGLAKGTTKECKSLNLPCYVERSRSGKGGHLWWFFESDYPAYKSRKIFLHILKRAKVIDEFDQEDSFDRLFPSQDYLGGKGFGNLIALPLQKFAREHGNTVFLSPKRKFAPYEDQWEFLGLIEKIPTAILDKLFDEFASRKDITLHQAKGDVLSITLAGQITIPKSKLPASLSRFLTDKLNFVNSDYIIKRKMGISTFGTERYFKTITKNDHNIFIPRGFLKRLIGYCNENDMRFSIEDRRKKFEGIVFKPTFQLFDYQREAVEALNDEENGVLVAPPGSGKTIIGLALAARKAQPTLIIVHRKQIYNQWLERIQNFLQIPKKEIGQFASPEKLLKSPITVAMIQTLIKMDNLEKLASQFGLVIVDECHHVPARMFRQVITKFNSYYLYGLTATPQRKNSDEKMIFVYLGDILYEIPKNYSALPSEVVSPKVLEIIIKDTNLAVPFNIRNDDFFLLSKILIFDSERNLLIAADIATKAKEGYTCLVLTERKEHVEVLSYYLKRDFEVITLTGDMSQRKRQDKIKQIHAGHFQILIATGQLVGEGADFQNLDCLFLVFPFAFEGKLIQYMGRIQHGKGKVKMVYDYRDKSVEFLEQLFKKRQRYYNKIRIRES